MRVVTVGLAVAEVEAGAFGAAGRSGERLDEPRVFARAVVRNEIHQDLDPVFAGFGEQCVELGDVAVLVVDREVVRDVVAVVELRRRVARVQPDRVDAERRQVTQA